MIRIFMLAAIAIGLFTPPLAPVKAQEITASEREACSADYEKFCRGTFPGGGRILRCLEKHYAELGNACKKVVDGYKK
jgi:hypothetical protein